MANTTGCRDCALCTGNAFTGFTRQSKRLGTDLATLGISRLARRICKICGHPMDEHGGQTGERIIATPAAAPAPTPVMTPDDSGELDKLIDYHSRGILTEEEFTAAKKKLLGI